MIAFITGTASTAAVFGVVVDPPMPGCDPDRIVVSFSTGDIRITRRAALYLHGRLAAALAELPDHAP